MKLSTFMLEERFFKIQTPLNPSREIAIREEFNDQEFDRFEIGLHTISFYVGDNKVCELSHVKGKMVGTDTRGGETILEPTSASRSKFDRYWKPERVRPIYVEPVELQIDETELAIISDLKEARKYKNVSIKRSPKILEEIDTLFKKGFKKVLYIQAAPVDFDSFVSLMVNLSDSFKDDQKVGAVQGYSRGVSTDAASVSVEQNEWDGFIINQKQWSIVKGKVLKAKTRNFTRSLSVVFDEKKLVRLSLDMSRNKQYTKSDARRKKFNV
jgi:hypothetical protein